MRSIFALLLTSTVVLVAIGVCASFAQQNTNTPTVEFLSAALRNQEVACGQSLEIEYTCTWNRYVGDKADRQSKTKYRYIRTPAVFRVDEDKEGKIIRTFYDRNKSEYRYLAVGDTEHAAIRGEDWGKPFLNREFLETTNYLLGKVPLYKKVLSGAVRKEKETIAERQCWVVDIVDEGSVQVRYTIWLDPSIGFNPRRIEFTYGEGTPEIVSFRNYSELCEGFYFPTEMYLEYCWPEKQMVFRQLNSVEKTSVGREIPRSEVDIVFPSGTQVLHNGGIYTVP